MVSIRNALNLDLKKGGPPATAQLRAPPQVRHIDESPIWVESQQTWVIRLAAVAMTPDGGGGMAVGSNVTHDI